MKHLIMLVVLLSSVVFGLELKGTFELWSGDGVGIAMVDGTSKVIVPYKDTQVDISGVKIVDYSDPSNPKIIGTYDVNESCVNDIKIVGDVMYVTTANGTNYYTPDNTQFDVVDISDLLNPKLIKRVVVRDYDYYRSGRKIAISHDKTKLAVSTFYKTKIYDITDPKNPVEKVDLDSVDNLVDSSATYALSFSVDDKYIFAMNEQSDDCKIYNIENQSNISLTFKFESVGWVNAILQSKDGNKVIISDPLYGQLNIYDFDNGVLSNEQNISLGSGNAPQDMVMTKDGKYIYIAVGGDHDHPGVVVYDILNQTIVEDINLSDKWFATRKIALSEDESTLIVATDYKNFVIDTGKSISTSTDNFSISIKPGWNLLGAVTNIDTSVFPNSIKTIWRYKGGEWFLHINSELKSQSNNNFGFDELKNLQTGDGFWVFNDTSNIITVNNDNNLQQDINTTLVCDLNLTNSKVYISVSKPLYDPIVTVNTPDGIKVARKDYNNNWSFSTIANTTNNSQFTDSKYNLLFTVYDSKIISSKDCGETWSNPVNIATVNNINIGGGKLAVSQYSDKLYIPYHIHSGTFGLHLSYSEDNGTTWQTKEDIYTDSSGDKEAGYGISIALDPIGSDVYISHGVHNAQTELVVTKIKASDGNITHKSIQTSGHFRDSSIKVYNNNIHLVYFDENTNSIKYTNSNDGGDTFTSSVVIYSGLTTSYLGYVNLNLEVFFDYDNTITTVSFIEDGILKIASKKMTETTWKITEIDKTLNQASSENGAFTRVDSFYDYNGNYYLYYIDKYGDLREYKKENNK
jgi:hypothetical protein